MDWHEELCKAVQSIRGEELVCMKGQVYVLSCGVKTYTWQVASGVFFTTLRAEGSSNELANTVWRKGDIIHSLDADIMLPAHALTDGVLLRIDSVAFNNMVRSRSDLSFALAQHYHNQFTNTLLHYRQAALEPSQHRLSRLEEYFANIEELDGSRVDDSTLALFLGVHRVSVSRLRKKIEKEAEETP